MSYITLNSPKLFHNYQYLEKLFSDHEIHWAIVAKLLCGHEDFLKVVLQMTGKDLCDSRLSNLKTIKELSPGTRTIYIKPPARRLAASIVRFADVSFNTELNTIKALSDEAVQQQKVHKIVIMVEMGELREGIMAKDLPQFFGDVLKLPNIEVVGIGTNLNCLNGILPDERKLFKLNRYKEIVEEMYGREIPYVSAGSSVTIPLLFKNQVPEGINHFRIGETLFFGTDVYQDSVISGMYQDVFTLTVEIIEMREKPVVPAGTAGTNLTGDTPVHDQKDIGKTSVRAIADVGLLDIDQKNICPVDPEVEIIGASSDMMILDLGDNASHFKVGDTLEFTMNYMAVLRAMNSDYVDKKVVQKVAANDLKILEFRN